MIFGRDWFAVYMGRIHIKNMNVRDCERGTLRRYKLTAEQLSVSFPNSVGGLCMFLI